MFFPKGPELPPKDHPEHVPFEELDSGAAQILYEIDTLQRLHKKAFAAIFNQEELQHAQGFCLKVIAKEPGLSQRELAGKLRIERATATVMLQKMERAGLIERRTDPDDQRITRIFLTERGTEADRRSEDACESFILGCLSGIDEAEKDALLRTLRVIEGNMRAGFEKIRARDTRRPDPDRGPQASFFPGEKG